MKHHTIYISVNSKNGKVLDTLRTGLQGSFSEARIGFCGSQFQSSINIQSDSKLEELEESTRLILSRERIPVRFEFPDVVEGKLSYDCPDEDKINRINTIVRNTFGWGARGDLVPYGGPSYYDGFGWKPSGRDGDHRLGYISRRFIHFNAPIGVFLEPVEGRSVPDGSVMVVKPRCEKNAEAYAREYKKIFGRTVLIGVRKEVQGDVFNESQLRSIW